MTALSRVQAYETALDDVVAALRFLHDKAAKDAEREISKPDYDPRESARALGKQDGILEAHRAVLAMRTHHKASR